MSGWVSVSLLCAGWGGGACGLTGMGGKRRWDRLGAIRGGDQVTLCLPDLVSGLGDDGTGMCIVELSRNAGPQVATSAACA